MQCSVPFVKQSLCLQRWDNGCTVRFVYRIFEYSFVLGILDSLGFRIFVLALVNFISSRSESSSEVLFIILTWLIAQLNSAAIKPEELQAMYLAYNYDNV